MTRRNVFRSSVAIASLATAGLLLAACGGAGDADSPESGAASGGASASASGDAMRVWFMQDSAPEESLEWLKTEWDAKHPEQPLEIEIQQWNGILEKLQTTLASDSEAPDLVEIGNTDVAGFSSYGALTDISDMKDALGGKDLIESLVEAGSADGKLYAAPLYAGSRVVFYRPSLFEKAGIEVPETIDDFVDAAIALQAANPEGTDGFSGIYMPGKDTGANHSILFTYGGDYAIKEGDKWVPQLNTADSRRALEQMQRIWKDGTTAALDSQDQTSQPWVPFNEGKAGMFVGMGFSANNIEEGVDWDVFVLPGLEAGTPGHAIAGGSNIAIPTKGSNQELSKELLQMVMSEDFLAPFASVGGWVPGNFTFGESLNETPVGEASLIATEYSMGTPVAPGWGALESTDVLRNFYTQLASGADLDTSIKEVDEQIELQLNQ